ncbi:MAG: extracellular solute-binding protein [Limnochordia bacterium]
MNKSTVLFLAFLLFCSSFVSVAQGAPIDVGIVGTSVERLEPLLREWAAEKGIEIGVVEYIGWNSEKVINRALAGIPYDVVCAVIEEADVLRSQGLLLPLDSLIATDPDFAEDLYEDIHPALLDMFNFDGKQYYIPCEWNLCLMYINTAMVQQSSLAYPPADWDFVEFRNYARKLSVDLDGDGVNDEYGHGAFSWNPWHMGLWIHGFGGQMLNEKWTESRMNMPETIEALEFIQGMLEEGSMAPVVTQWDYLPEHDKCAMWVTGRTPLRIYRDLNWTDFDIQHAPSYRGRGTALGGAGYGISANTKDKEAAWEVLKFITGKEMELKLYGEDADAMAFAARRSAGFYELDPNVPPKNAIAFMEALDYATTVPSPPQYPQIDQIFWDYLGIIWRSEDSAPNVAAQMHNLINSILVEN